MGDEAEANNDRIYVDDSLPATLRYPGRTLVCETLHAAIIAWRKLGDGPRNDATIQVDVEGGNLYQASEIARLYRDPRPVAVAHPITQDNPVKSLLSFVSELPKRKL